MKKYLAARMRLSAILIAGALGTFSIVTPKWVDAQSAPEKIRLMADTLRARSSGDLNLAKMKAEELIKIAPEDENVQRLLASINLELDRLGSTATAPALVVPSEAEGDDSDTVSNTKVSDAEPSDVSSEIDSIVEAAAAAQDTKIASAEMAIEESKKLSRLGAFSQANSLLNAASSSLSLSTATADTLASLESAKAALLLDQARGLADSGDLKSAELMLEQYRSAGGNSKRARSLSREINSVLSDPYALDIAEISSEYVAQSKIVRDLLVRARAQYLNGDYDGASATFKEVEARDPHNSEAKLFQTKIAALLGNIHKQNVYKTRGQMLAEVDQNWERPKVFDVTSGKPELEINPGLQEKLNSIVIPQVNFNGMELTRVVETLSELSVEYDAERVGVNIVPLFNPNDTNPRVNISLRNLNLDRVLQFVTQQVNFAYDVGGDAVTISPDGGSADVNTVTEFFPISRATVIRLTGFRDNGGASSGPIDPFAAPISSGSSGPSANEEVEALQNFFQSAGVNFELPGASLAFDGEQLIITQTRRNLERMRVILRNYNEVKQVEIEAKFLEVAQNDLEEVGFDWTVTDTNKRTVTQGRSLVDAFSTNSDTSTITIDKPASVEAVLDTIIINEPINERFPTPPPVITSSLDLASGASSLFTASGWSVNGYDVDLAIQALSRKTGSDLMSAPKVTVLSGKRASITVAQELRYPESYGDIESEVTRGSGNGSSSGASAVSITAGTPQDFVTRNVGVEMAVTPNVENDDTISLILEPRVTEFEGFVEYGGPSVALGSDGTVVTVPAGFYQPIFSVREMSTEVTVFDGATVVMGGLTRDEIKTVNDKVPVLGDIPGVGRLFRSEGETRQKRNLLIFVTANLVSPGGSPARQNYRNVNANSLFQNPTIMTPAGGANRTIGANSEK